PALEQLAQLTKTRPGRVIGFNCLLANLAGMAGLCDIRGYDGVDPKQLKDLLALTSQNEAAAFEYAYTQRLVPQAPIRHEGEIALPPILDMLGVRYVIFREEAPTNSHPIIQSFDYFILENRRALDRLFVPQRTEFLPNGAARLQRMAANDFDPRDVAFVE